MTMQSTELHIYVPKSHCKPYSNQKSAKTEILIFLENFVASLAAKIRQTGKNLSKLLMSNIDPLAINFHPEFDLAQLAQGRPSNWPKTKIEQKKLKKLKKTTFTWLHFFHGCGCRNIPRFLYKKLEYHILDS